MKPTPQEVLRALADGKIIVNHKGFHFCLDMFGCLIVKVLGQWDIPETNIDSLIKTATRIIGPAHIADASKKVEPEPITPCQEIRAIQSNPELAELVDAMNAANKRLEEKAERQKAKDELLLVTARAVRDALTKDSLNYSIMVDTLIGKAFPEDS